MSALNLFPVFLVGLLGSVHCAGMCGGIVSAMSIATAPVKRFPIAIVGVSTWKQVSTGGETLMRVTAYNLGRISSYALAGALAGGLARSARTLVGLSALQMDGYWIVNVILIGLGLYLTGWWRGMAYLENAGRIVWKCIYPLTTKLLPLDSSLKMLAAGGVWGWLPCGMVYSMLFTALMSGSAVSGAAIMVVFGLGTLPMLLTLGLLGEQIKVSIRRPVARCAGGLLVIGFGVLGLMRAAHGMPPSWLDALCVASVGNGAGL
jgi:sulfite exporter TauE/SafE